MTGDNPHALEEADLARWDREQGIGDKIDNRMMEYATRESYVQTRAIVDSRRIRLAVDWNDVVSLSAEVLALESMLIAKIEDRLVTQGTRRVQCREGCSWCCHQHVFATTPELAVLAASAIAAGDAQEVERRARASGHLVARLSHTQRYAKAVPCTLLDVPSGRCTAYSARPSVCRSHASLSKRACEQDFRRRASDKPRTGVPTILTSQLTAIGCSTGLDAALLEVGLEMERVELARGLAMMLEEETRTRWLRGERVFAAAAHRTHDGSLHSMYVTETLARMFRSG